MTTMDYRRPLTAISKKGDKLLKMRMDYIEGRLEAAGRHLKATTGMPYGFDDIIFIATRSKELAPGLRKTIKDRRPARFDLEIEKIIGLKVTFDQSFQLMVMLADGFEYLDISAERDRRKAEKRKAA